MNGMRCDPASDIRRIEESIENFSSPLSKQSFQGDSGFLILRSLEFGFKMFHEMDFNDIAASFNGCLKKFDKENCFAELSYIPERHSDEITEISGNFSLGEGCYKINNMKKILVNIPFTYNPNNPSKIPIILSAVLENVPKEGGVAVKWKATLNMIDLEKTPQHFQLLFLITRKNKKSMAKILIKQGLDFSKLKESPVPEELLDKPFYLKTSIKHDIVKMEIGDSFSLEHKLDKSERFLSAPELMYPEIFAPEMDVKIVELELSGQVFPYWIVPRAVSFDTKKAEQFFSRKIASGDILPY
ncbi:MAG TPA: hypothetical protein PK821_02085 [Victivallales bacterium]|nr:hypothetical protein [Victivallales bacterium]